MQLPSGLTDRSPVEMQQGALSLKARETASLSLKRIFEQHLHMSTCNSATSTHSSQNSDHEYRDVDLDLKLAAPSTSGTSTDMALHQGPLMQNKSLAPTRRGGQLTVFYAGSVCVFENIPADKAKAIMLLAAGSAGNPSSANAVPKSRPTTPLKPLTRSQAELPFARKASLARFLEKRKDRIETKAVAEEEIKDANCGEISEPPKKRVLTKL